MEAASQVVGKVTDILFGAAITEIGYMCNCTENVKILNEELEKLTALKEMLQQRIYIATQKGENPGKDLENWMNNATAKISKATEFITQEDKSKKTCCNLSFCVNLGTLHRYGKTAAKEVSLLQKQQQDGECFKTCVFDPLPGPRYTDTYQPKNLESIYSQRSTLEEITKAIKDDKIQIVGIVGFGGVGKTTLASEVATKMKDAFADIVFIPVSKTIKVEKIKEKVETAARRILNGEKILIILDDVWEELKLEEVGIPCGSDKMNCKILLTSRNKDVCDQMNAQTIVTVNPLVNEEALALFERCVGITESKWDIDNNLRELALQIVNECGGLPLFVQAVGKALKGKEIKSWEAALNRLKAPIHGDVKYKKDGILQLKLSYDHLEDEVAKKFFLMCSMFPEDASVRVETLVYYGLGLGIFDNIPGIVNIQDARHRVQVAIDALESSFLLLPRKSRFPRFEESLQMHDLFRDMAMLVTSEGNDKFWVESGIGLREWQAKKNLESYKKISLMGNKIGKLRDHKLVFPHLNTFLVQDNGLSVVPDEFFQGMEKLEVLDMSGNHISSLPQSLIRQLTILRLLDLSGNLTLTKISILGELTCLEILKLRNTGITVVPEEIGKLINLRLLDVFRCKYLSYVARGVISKLSLLEELYVGLKEEEEGGKSEFLLELSELKFLKVLHVVVPSLHHIPPDFDFDTLIEFHILQNSITQINQALYCKGILEISDHALGLPNEITKLIQLSDKLALTNIKDLDNILELCPEGCDELKYIALENCDVRSLVKTSKLDALETSNENKRCFFPRVEQIGLSYLEKLEVLWDIPHQCISFCNLQTLKVVGCPSILSLFPSNVARGLVNLRQLSILFCDNLLAVISAGDEQTVGGSKTKEDIIVFPFLTRINFEILPNLESFCSDHSFIEYPSLKVIRLFECPNMKRWSYEESHIPKLKFEHEMKPYSNINDYIAAQIEMNGSLQRVLRLNADDIE